MKAVDCHCHLDFEQFDGDRHDLISRSQERLEFVVNAGTNFDSNRKTLEIQERYPDFVEMALGLHPSYTDCFSELESIKAQIREKDPVAIGEIGLDHHHVSDKDTRERQVKVFREMLEVAESLGKPVVIHSRDAEEKALEILESYSVEPMMHCFNGRPELVPRASDLGKVGITTQVLYSDRVSHIVKLLDLENILLETDSPFLYQGKRNEPVNVLESAAEIADIKSVSTEKVVNKTTANAEQFFAI